MNHSGHGHPDGYSTQRSPELRGCGRSWEDLRPDGPDDTWPRITSRDLLHQTQHHAIHRIGADFGTYAKVYDVDDTGVRAGLVVVLGGNVLLTSQYRLLVDRVTWEIPGGGVDEGETPEETAIRECFEETGVRALDALPLLCYHLGLDTEYNPTYFFYSHRIEQAVEPGKLRSTEGDESGWFPLARCLTMLRAGEIQDSFTVIGLLAYSEFIAAHPERGRD